MPTPEEILTDLNTNILPAVADLTNSVQTAIASMNALKDKAAVQTDKADELFSLAPADVTMPNGDIVPNFAKVRDDLQTAITAFTSVVYLEATDQAVDSAKLEGKTLLEISTEIKSAIIDGAPAIYDTLLEISNALTDDDTAINGLLTQLGSLSTSLADLAVVVADKAPAVHEHDSRYYTKSQTDAVFSRPTGFKNYIINGAFNVNQYARGTQVNFPLAFTPYVDRFCVVSSSSVTMNGALSNPVGFTNHLSVTKTAGTDTMIIQKYELPVKDKAKAALNGRTFTFSCWVMSSTANMIENIYILKQGSTAGAYEERGSGQPGTAASIAHAANVWTRIWFTMTFDWLSEAGECLDIRIDPANTLAGTLHTTGWQLEEGSVATPFEHRPYGLELALCKRYFERRRLAVFAPVIASNYGGSVPVNISNTFRVSPSFSVNSVLASSNWVGSLACISSSFGSVIYSSVYQTTPGAYIDAICDFSAEL